MKLSDYLSLSISAAGRNPMMNFLVLQYCTPPPVRQESCGMPVSTRIILKPRWHAVFNQSQPTEWSLQRGAVQVRMGQACQLNTGSLQPQSRPLWLRHQSNGRGTRTRWCYMVSLATRPGDRSNQNTSKPKENESEDSWHPSYQLKVWETKVSIFSTYCLKAWHPARLPFVWMWAYIDLSPSIPISIQSSSYG